MQRRDHGERLSDPRQLSTPTRFSALVACAAVGEFAAAVGPTFASVASPRFERSFSGVLRKLTWLAIARMARPRHCSSAMTGALACYMLLSRSSERRSDLPWLLPGAMLSRDVDAFALLDEFANTYYREIWPRLQFRPSERLAHAQPGDRSER